MYLGLFAHQQEDYGYVCAKNIVEELTGKTIKKSSTSSKKKKIPKKIKNDSWDRYIGKKIAPLKLKNFFRQFCSLVSL